MIYKRKLLLLLSIFTISLISSSSGNKQYRSVEEGKGHLTANSALLFAGVKGTANEGNIKTYVKRMLDEGHTPNRLINEKSPYLLQHAFNPVDWYPGATRRLIKRGAKTNRYSSL